MTPEEIKIEKREKDFKEFKTLCDPLIKYINDNYHPHTHIIIDSVRAELSTGERAYTNKEFIRD